MPTDNWRTSVAAGEQVLARPAASLPRWYAATVFEPHGRSRGGDAFSDLPVSR